MSLHTPGPWNVGWSFWPNDEEIAYGINRGKGTVSDVEARANASLIATAPKLRAMLSRVLAALETPGDLTGEERQHVIEDAGALLAEIEEDA